MTQYYLKNKQTNWNAIIFENDSTDNEVNQTHYNKKLRQKLSLETKCNERNKTKKKMPISKTFTHNEWVSKSIIEKEKLEKKKTK